MINELFSYFQDKDPVLFSILAILCVGWVVILERIILLQFIFRLDFAKFNSQIRPMLASGDSARAKSLCNACGKTGLPRIVYRAIETFESDNYRVRHVVTEETMDFFPRIRRRISQLPNLATVAVLLGALACVHGVWESFQTANILELNLKNYALTMGLSKAMIPLSFAIFCTIVLILPFGFLDSLASRIEAEYEHSLAIVLNLIAPETQPVFGQFAPEASAKSSSPGSLLDHNIPINDDESAMRDSKHNLSDLKDKKGQNEDSAEASRADAVPDEEEII